MTSGFMPRTVRPVSALVDPLLVPARSSTDCPVTCATFGRQVLSCTGRKVGCKVWHARYPYFRTSTLGSVMQLSFRSRRSRPRLSDSRGQGLVEFALIVPVVLLILLFAIDLGRAYYSWVILQNASRIGANYAALNPEGWEGDSAAIQAEYAALVSGDWGTIDCPSPAPPVFSDGTDTSSSGQTPDTSYNVGDSVKVSLTCPFRPITPVISAIVGDTVQLGASSDFRIRSGDIAGLINQVRIPPPVVASPSPTPTACLPASIAVPNLVGSTVVAARSQWAAAGFTGAFSPANGSNNKIVTGQNPPAGGPCVPATTSMTVTHT